MQTSEAIDKLLPALHKARQAMLPAAKSAMNTFDKYNYATEADWHAAVTPALQSEGLVLMFSANLIENLPPRETKRGGNEYPVQMEGRARLFHTSGQWIEIGGFGQGQDRGDKGCYKAATGMKKYLYALIMALPTADDPEKDSRPRTRTPAEQPPGRSAKPASKAGSPGAPPKPANELVLAVKGWAGFTEVEEELSRRRKAGSIDAKEVRSVASLLKERRFSVLMDILQKAKVPSAVEGYDEHIQSYPYEKFQRDQLVATVKGMKEELAQ